MKATRIKWDEAMMLRCLARVADYPKPAVKKAPIKKVELAVEELEVPSVIVMDIPSEAPVAEEENEFKLELDIPVESVTLEESYVKEAPKAEEGNEFKLELVIPIEPVSLKESHKKEAPKAEEEAKLEIKLEDGYTFKWDKPLVISETEAFSHGSTGKWDDFLKSIDKAL